MTTTQHTDPTVYVDPCPGMKGSERVTLDCYCDNGVYTAPSKITWQRGSVEAPWCFQCNGSGKYTVLVSSLRAGARKRAKAAAAERDAELQAETNLATWRATAGELVAKLDKLHELNETLAESLRGSIASKGQLSEKQAALLVRIVDERAAQEAAKTDCPTGRLVITGEVVSVKEEQDRFSYHDRTITKLIVRDDRGFTVMGTCPSSIEYLNDEQGYVDFASKIARGMRVTFTAAVEQGQRDASFGFFKRPTKAARV